DLAGTQDAVAENRKDIDKNTSNIKELAVGIQDNILPALEANRTDIDANKADVETLKNRADGAAAAVNLLAQNIALNKTNIESKADQDYVEGLEQDVKINTSDIKELSEGIRDNILPALEANRTDIDKNASRITDTRNKQVLQNARLDNHSSRIDANKAALETKADKTALEAKADKTALEAKADKTALEAKADKTALEAKADKTALEAKADKVYVGSLEQNIRDNSNRIETNKVDVSALRNDISSHTKRLDHLDNRVNKLDKDLKRGLATQAALTGLFQPYTVGKANFTAAVGGYKSQTAVAIGTGYRYNKHVATKAGVAFTQGGAAYNVGVNFEW
ncbi:MAG: YadA-like family protein, partial [Haemophilus parahaemolyticus]|uniref:YadA-like family protein n=1 Tax=Haemophilus parahaemolyticus TaxID=735 RepID=UPI0027E8E994